MAEATLAAADVPKKRGKLPLILGVVGAVALGMGGFYASYSGLLFGGQAAGAEGGAHGGGELAGIAFVPVDPLVISLGQRGNAQHLRFSAQLEVAKPYQSEVEQLLPRILDVLNGYLRAVDIAELEDPTALIRLRAQMLRRIQMVTGEGRVRDLLITEFVLN